MATVGEAHPDDQGPEVSSEPEDEPGKGISIDGLGKSEVRQILEEEVARRGPALLLEVLNMTSETLQGRRATRAADTRDQRMHESQAAQLEALVQARIRDDDLADRVYESHGRVARLDAYMRALLATLLVLGTLGIVFWGVVSGVDAERLAQYVAPIAGLAGLAVGYFFGRTSSDSALLAPPTARARALTAPNGGTKAPPAGTS